jgi:gliding motility-associated-like protein
VYVKLYNGITYYIPNAFSPNGDGLNDVLKAIPAGISSTSYFTIFNRWGQPIFSTADLSVGWDGTYKGKKQPAGTYVWMIKGTARNGQLIEMTGTVQVIR